jgi:hypothetical protein
MNLNILVKISKTEMNQARLKRIFNKINQNKNSKNNRYNRIQADNWILIQIFQIKSRIDKQNMLWLINFRNHFTQHKQILSDKVRLCILVIIGANKEKNRK